jgi:hypothetical protein
MRRIVRESGLSIALFTLVFASIAGQSLAGHHGYSEDQRERGQPAVS